MQYEHDHDGFYKSQKWKQYRQKILRRDHYTCQNCKRYGRLVEAVEVHHIEHLEDCPERAYDPTNLISLCKKCHRKAHPEKVEGLNKMHERLCY